MYRYTFEGKNKGNWIWNWNVGWSLAFYQVEKLKNSDLMSHQLVETRFNWKFHWNIEKMWKNSTTWFSSHFFYFLPSAQINTNQKSKKTTGVLTTPVNLDKIMTQESMTGRVKSKINKKKIKKLMIFESEVQKILWDNLIVSSWYIWLASLSSFLHVQKKPK